MNLTIIGSIRGIPVKDNKGITLIELLIVLALIGLVLLLVVTLFLFGNRSFNRQNEHTAIVANVRYSMDYLTKQVRKANEIEVNGNVLFVDSSEIKIEDRTLYKDDDEITTEIDELVVSKDGNKVQIEIVIIYSNSEEYRLSSIVYIR